MGLCASSGQSAAVGAEPTSAVPTQDNDRAVSGGDVSCDVVDELYDARYGVTYAFVSQRGYYPHQLRKPNQDAFICASLNKDPNAFVMGVRFAGVSPSTSARSRPSTYARREARSATRRPNAAQVFDGHGAEGDLCAQFVARKLVYCLEREIATLLRKQKLSSRVAELYDPTANAGDGAGEG